MITNELNQAKVLPPRAVDAAIGAGNLGKLEAGQAYTWPDLTSLLQHPAPSDIDHAKFLAAPKEQRNTWKKTDKFILFGTCQNDIRDDAHLISRSALSLDFDENTSTLFWELDCGKTYGEFAFAWHTTRSHTAEAPRLRVFVPLARDVTPAEYRPLCVHVATLFGSALDPASVKPAQMMFLPVQNQGADFLSGSRAGEGFLNPDYYLARADPAAVKYANETAARRQLTKPGDYDPLVNAAPPISGITLDIAREHLDKLDPDMPEPEWLNVLRALHHQGSGLREAEAWLEAADAWSSNGQKYTEGVTELYWNRLAASPNAKPTTFATVMKMVQDIETAEHDGAIDQWKARIAKAESRGDLQEKLPKAIAKDKALSKFARDELAQTLQARIETTLAVKLDKRALRKLMEPALHHADHQVKADGKFKFTEHGNACRMVARFGHTLMHVAEDATWYGWTGCYWRRVPEAAIRQHATEIIVEMSRTIPDGLEGAALAEYHSWCALSQRASMVGNMVSFVAIDRAVLTPFNELDRDRNLLGVGNGAINLTTGELQSPDKSDYITITTGVEYDPAAACPLFERTVSEAFFGNPEMVAFFQRVVGYSLLGSPKEDVLVIPYGSGSNGKSTILNAIQSVLGGHAKSTAAATFLSDGRSFGGGSGPNEALLRLRGSRFVYMAEPDEGSQLREGLIKAVTGGDVISARGVHAKHSVEFLPSWVIFMPTNHRPIVKGTDQGIWRRLLPLPFERNFSHDDSIPNDPDRAEKLKAEYSGILRWCVAGALDYQRCGLRPPQAVKDAHAAYKTDMDLLAEWLEDEWEKDSNGYAPVAELWFSWEAYSKKCGLFDLIRNKNYLSRALQDRGFEQLKRIPKTEKRGFRGLKRRVGIDAENSSFLD